MKDNCNVVTGETGDRCFTCDKALYHRKAVEYSTTYGTMEEVQIEHEGLWDFLQTQNDVTFPITEVHYMDCWDCYYWGD